MYRVFGFTGFVGFMAFIGFRVSRVGVNMLQGLGFIGLRGLGLRV